MIRLWPDSCQPYHEYCKVHMAMRMCIEAGQTRGTVQRENGCELKWVSRCVPGRITMSGKGILDISDPSASPLP